MGVNRSRALAGALVVLAALASPAQAGKPSQERPGFVGILRSVESRQTPPQIERLVSALVKTPDAVPAFLDIRTRGELPAEPAGEPLPLNTEQEHLLELTAPRLEHRAVIVCVSEQATKRFDEPWRHCALDLLRWHSTASEFPLLVDLIRDEQRRVPQEGPLIEVLQSVLAEVILRDPEFASKLPRMAEQAGPLRGMLVHAVGSSRRSEALPWLAEQLAEPETAMVALQEVSRLAPLAPPNQVVELAAKVRPFLRSTDAGARKHAMRAIAALHDSTAIPRLMLILQHSEGSERKTALLALQELTGLGLPATANAWLGWYREEHRWLEEEATSSLSQLSSDREGEVIAGIRALSQHSLHRERWGTELARLVRNHESSAVRGQACLGLARLGSTVALDDLVSALEDHDSSVRDHALTALRAITELSLPPVAEEWQAALGASKTP